MQIRYDFSEKLDLSRFKKQAPHYIGTMREMVYWFYLPDYRIEVQITCTDNTTNYLVKICIDEIVREYLSTKYYTIHPDSDIRFADIKIIQNTFTFGPYAELTSNDVKQITNTICDIVKVVHKINGLKAFL